MTLPKLPMLKPQPFLMVNKVQNYAWGTTGAEAFIPRFLGIQTDVAMPFAELWMGTHPNAPSTLVIDGEKYSLERLIAQQPDFFLGTKTAARFGGRLPFLLKILSAGQPLSIQAHPDKKQAVTLHAADAENYPDDNHKPEIAIALSEFHAMAGFRSTAEIAQTLQNYPEIAEFIGTNTVQQFLLAAEKSPQVRRQTLKKLFTQYLQKTVTAPNILSSAIEKLQKRLDTQTVHSRAEHIFLQMQQKYAETDAGLFSVFFLNYIILQPGQAIFIPAGIPHAYIHGNIIECMANSDNVVRAGLTTKFQDKINLLKILTYEAGPVEIFGQTKQEPKIKYKPPVEEFSLFRYHLEKGDSFHCKLNSVAILLILNGKIQIKYGNVTLFSHQGQSVFLPASLNDVRLIAEEKSMAFLTTVPEGTALK